MRLHRLLLLAFALTAITLPAAAQQPRPSPSSQQHAPYRVGERVQVRWHGTWFDATIIEVGTGSRAGTYKIRYDGYDSSWDEYAGPDRIARPANAAPSSGDEKSAAAGLVAEGRYVCQSFEAGQLHNQGEFVLRAGGTYQDVWNRSSGRWTLDRATGRLQFTGGSLQNGASARLIRTAQGKTAVEFTWNEGAKRWCYRQSN